jgi:hypothetical protein
MKKLILLALASLITSTTYAAEGSSLTIGPIIGYEKIHRYAPVERSVDRLTYGLRLVYGVPLLSVEAQLTQAKDTEDLPSYSLKVEEKATTGMLGVKSSFEILQQSLSWYLRGGAHGSKREVTKTQNGVITTENPGVKVSPYAGTGLNINIMNKVRLDAGITVVFPKSSGEKNDYLGTLGFSIHI